MFIGIDIGGSGSRLILDSPAGRQELSGPQASVKSDGDSIEEVAHDLLETAKTTWPQARGVIRGIGIGSTGVGTLIKDPQKAADRLAQASHAQVALAIDAVTAHLGALDGQPGAVISLGTGAIAVGWDGNQEWSRVDGWGHLLGDRGGGVWIGSRGLRAALEFYDGITTAGKALFDAAAAKFGGPLRWPSQLYPRPDSAGLVAGFAQEVVKLAEQDPVAYRIVDGAAWNAANSLGVAAERGGHATVSAVGGLVPTGGTMERLLCAHLSRQYPHLGYYRPLGSSVDGAVTLARRISQQFHYSLSPHMWVSQK